MRQQRRDTIRARHVKEQAEGYLELGLARQALETLCRLEGEECRKPQILYLRGEALRELKRYEEAVHPLGQAAKTAPDHIPVRIALGWCYKRCNLLPKAIETLLEAAEIEPDNALVQYNLACYFSLAGDKDETLGYLRRALEIDPSFRLLIDEEPDFDPMRCDPDFLALASTIV